MKGSNELQNNQPTLKFKDFKLSEFTCNCGCGLNNVKLELVAALQKLRDAVGKPIRITSGTRCPAHNERVGGAKNSRHLVGEAADIKIDGIPYEEAVEAAKQVPEFKGLGWGAGILHVDIRRQAGRTTWRYDK